MPKSMAVSAAEVQIASVARHYELSPIEVERWPITKFLKYQEVQFLHREMERQQYDKEPGDNDGNKGKNLETFVRRQSEVSGKTPKFRDPALQDRAEKWATKHQ